MPFGNAAIQNFRECVFAKCYKKRKINMIRYSKDNDPKLYRFFDELKKSFNAKKPDEFYSVACSILNYVINVGAQNGGHIKLKTSILAHGPRKDEKQLKKCLQRDDIKLYLENVGINVSSCEECLQLCELAHKGTSTNLLLDKIKESAVFIIDTVFKIYQNVYQETAPTKENLKNELGINFDQNSFLSPHESDGKKRCPSSFEKTDSNDKEHNEITQVKEKPSIETRNLNSEGDTAQETQAFADDGYISVEDQLDAFPRLPICICLDLSGSMRGEKFIKMKEGIADFCNAILNDPKAKRSAEIAVITFNSECTVYRKFARLTEAIHLDGVTPRTGTIFSPAINTALDILEQRKMEYQSLGMEYYQPWLLVFSDGLPADKCECVQQRTRELEERKKLLVLPIYILPSNVKESVKKRTLDFMGGFSATNLVSVDSNNIKDFFEFLSRSIHVSIHKGQSDISAIASKFSRKK